MRISVHEHRVRRLTLAAALAAGLVAIPSATADPLGDACGAGPAAAAALPAYHACALQVAIGLGHELAPPSTTPDDPAPLAARSRAFAAAVAAALDGPDAPAAAVLLRALPRAGWLPGPARSSGRWRRRRG